MLERTAETQQPTMLLGLDLSVFLGEAKILFKTQTKHCAVIPFISQLFRRITEAARQYGDIKILT